MSANTINVVSHPRLAGKVRHTLLEISSDKRLNDIKISVPENMSVDGLREGTYLLADAFKTIAGDVETIEISDADKNSPQDSDNEALINDPEASAKLVLKETYELLYMIADTPWLSEAKLEAIGPQNGIFIEGEHSFVGLVKSLGYLVEDAYYGIYGDEDEDEDEEE